jgi:hypothetical protein
VAGDERARQVAEVAAGLAAGARVALPADLRLWQLAGGRPDRTAPVAAADPAGALVTALEERLGLSERRRGAHYTPPDLADEVVALARVDASTRSVVDPACGAGALLLAAARRLAATGADPAAVARDRLYGADVDPLAVAVAEAAIALWSGGARPTAAHLVVGDSLAHGGALWPAAPAGGFDRVVGNPPFQGQLAERTARDADARTAVRARFGPAAAPYVDTAALFLLVAVELAAEGARVALVQPRSTAAARDARPVREALAARARLVDLVAPRRRRFSANVHVCIAVFEVGAPSAADPGVDVDAEWAGRLAGGAGVPLVALDGPGLVGDLATTVAGFRQHYYALVDHVREGGEGPVAPLVTSGLLDVGRCAWGERTARFARRGWGRPTVDVAAVAAADERLGRWLALVRRPKVVVASQTRVVEAAADHDGTWVPCTPALSVVPHEPADVDRLAAALCAPPVAAWAATRTAGTGMSPGSMRLSAAILREVPLPTDDDAWTEATALLAAGDLDRYADAATRMYALAPAEAAAVVRWWHQARRFGQSSAARGDSAESPRPRLDRSNRLGETGLGPRGGRR